MQRSSTAVTDKETGTIVPAQEEISTETASVPISA
jgi:hypothetical protein